MIRTTIAIWCLACNLSVAFGQESPEGYRRGFNDELKPIYLDLDGNGKQYEFNPRKFTKKVSYISKIDKQTMITEEHYLTFDLKFPSGKHFRSVFTYQYGTGVPGEWDEYWVYALIPPKHPVTGRTEVFFYLGDDTSDEMLRLRFKNGKFVVVSRKKPFSVD